MMRQEFLQSRQWEQFQQALGRQTFFEQGPNWHYLAFLEHGRISRRLFCPYGPVVEDLAGFRQAMASLSQRAAQVGADFIRIEPKAGLTKEELVELGWIKAARDVESRETLVNDVSVAEADIMAGLSQNARRIWRKLDKAGVEYETSFHPDDIADFLRMEKSVAARTGIQTQQEHYSRTLAQTLFPSQAAGLMFAELDGRRVAGFLFTLTDSVMSYQYAGSFSEYRKQSPATGLGVYGLLQAHRMGLKEFDWFGVAPEDADQSNRYLGWAGFTEFKSRFGGERRKYLGTWESPVRKGRYWLWRRLSQLSETRGYLARKHFLD